MNDNTASSQSTDSRLAPLRSRIDEIDGQLVALLNERARVSVEVGRVKNDCLSPEQRTAIYQPQRERQVLENARKANTGPLPDRCVEAIYRELMSASFALQRPVKVGCLGPAGSFSHLAAVRQFGTSVDHHTYDDIANVFDEVARGTIDLGLVPIENSTGGGITDTLDSFLETNAKVCAEVLIYVHHNLLCTGDPEEATTIYSRPEVFGQCKNWLNDNLTSAERQPVASSSKAVEMASHDPTIAAIGSSLAAEIYDVPIRIANIEDHPDNITRFFVIGKEVAKPSGDDKTAIMFTTAHKPGALAEVLDVFRNHEVNLTHIDKRPSRRVNWEYFFFVDCEGHADDENVTAALHAVADHCLHLTVLGSFPRARNVLG